MKKVIVIGSSGAGKSTFSRHLSKATGLKLIHLDKIFWQPNWTEPADKIAWRENLKEVLREDEWIVDGNFGSTLEMRLAACDTAILLDLPNYICVYRILKRWVFYGKGKRPDMAEGCHERFDWEFLKWTWNFPRDLKPKVERHLKQFESERKIIRLKSRSEVKDFLNSFKK